MTAQTVCCDSEMKLSSAHCVSSHHYESGERLWLQGEEALQMHSFRDAEPQPLISPNAKEKLRNVSQAAQTRHKHQPDHH